MRNHAFKTYIKYNIFKEDRMAPIPQLIWNDGHAEWSRWYFFKDKYFRVSHKAQYYNFK